MVQIEENDLVYKGPWVRSTQQRLFQTLEAEYAFLRATCRSLVNLIWDFANETFVEKIHDGQCIRRSNLNSALFSQIAAEHPAASRRDMRGAVA